MIIKSSLRNAIGLAMSALGLYLAFRGVNLQAVLKGMLHANLLLVAAAATLYGLAFVFRSLRWQSLLKPLGHLTATRCFWALMFGFFINQVLPLRAGELARAILVAGWLQIPATVCLGTVVSERLGDFFSLFLLCIIVSLNFPGARFPTKSLALTLTASAIVIWALVRSKGTITQTQFKSKWIEKAVNTIGRLIQGLGSVGTLRQLSMLMISSFLVWTFDLAAINTLARAYGLPLSPLRTGLLMIGIAFGVMLPAAPGYIGTYEYFGKKTLQLIGVPTQTALVFIVSLHFFQMMMISVFGAPALGRFGIPRLPKKTA